MTAISLVMPCYNRSYDLIRTLTTYDAQIGEEPFEIIAVDDGSSDETYHVLSSYTPTRFTLRAVQQEKNRGPAAARNLGISLATAPLILFVGDDIVPDPYLVQGHITAHRRYPDEKVAILGRVVWPNDLPTNTLMTHIDGIGAQQFSYQYLKNDQEYDYRHFYTANISLKLKFLNSLSRGFDTDFPYAAFEDVELSYRLATQGLRIIYVQALLGYHYHLHSIWTFSTRQYRAGLMACLLSQKHPEVRARLVGRGFPYRILKWRLLAALRNDPKDSASQLEDKVLHLSSAYEWTPHLLLNQLYMRVLAYFYVKGLIYGSLGETPQARQVHSTFAIQTLAPLLAWFAREDLRL